VRPDTLSLAPLLFTRLYNSLCLSLNVLYILAATHGEKEKINGPYLSELPSAFEDQAVARELGQAGRIDHSKVVETALTVATGMVSTLATITNDHHLQGVVTGSQTPHHYNTVSAWQALMGIFVILLIFTPLAGCYIYLVKQGMRGDLDLNWESLENKPKNQLKLAKPRKPSTCDIDMPSSRKNSTSAEPHPGANVVTETIQDEGPAFLLKNDSCALINLEDL